jgi:hypothetical protein
MKPAQLLSGYYPFKILIITMAFGAISYALSSCERCRGCSDSEGLIFYNFTKADLDSVLVKEYVAGTNFTGLKDSFYMVPSRYTDSLTFILNLNAPYYADSTHADMLVYIPADSLTFKITGVATSVTHCQRCPDITLYNFSSYYVNGIKDSMPVMPYAGYGGYFRITK